MEGSATHFPSMASDTTPLSTPAKTGDIISYRGKYLLGTCVFPH